MSGVKGKSGPLGNLNATRMPWRVFWRRRALRREDRWILPVLEGYAHGLEADKPGLTEAERRLTTIVAADIAGFSSLVGADEEGTLAAQRGHRAKLIDPLLEKYRGRMVNTAGDVSHPVPWTQVCLMRHA